MPILTIKRTPISFFSEAFSNLRRDLGGIFGEDLPRPLQQPIDCPDLFEAGHGKASSLVMACLGGDADCKSDDDDEAGGTVWPGQPTPKPEPASQFSSLPAHVMACLGGDADCKSDDDDEAGGTVWPGQPAPKPEPISRLSEFSTAIMTFFGRMLGRQPRFGSPHMVMA